MGVPIEKKRRNNVSGSWKKTKLEKNWYRGRGGFSRGGEATEGTPVILIGRGVQGGRGKLSTNV